jgi:transketolase
MRKTFFDLVYNRMLIHQNTYFITGDLGYLYVDPLKEFEGRFFNFQAAEQAMVGAGVGLALAGKKVICYSIVPFLISRAHEWLRNYLNHENIQVKLVGTGIDREYADNGFTHWSEDRHLILQVFPNIRVFEPKDKETLVKDFQEFMDCDSPCFMALRRL